LEVTSKICDLQSQNWQRTTSHWRSDGGALVPLPFKAAELRSWLKPIVRMLRFSKTNGITEVFHTKMEMRRA